LKPHGLVPIAPFARVHLDTHGLQLHKLTTTTNSLLNVLVKVLVIVKVVNAVATMVSGVKVAVVQRAQMNALVTVHVKV
jgi:hypothetical protein